MMPDREKVIKELESLRDICNAKSNMAIGKGKIAWAGYANTADDAIVLLTEQESIKQKMWNALYAEEDKLENQYAGTDKHDDWFSVYRPWLQRGFGIAIEVIAKQEGR